MSQCIRRTFTLLEMIIAMALAMILLTTLMYFYRDIAKMGQKAEALSDSYFYWQYAGSRLADILPTAVGESSKQEHDFLFYTIDDSPLTKPGSPSLVFIFDNGVSLDKLFSNHVLGRLFVDYHNRLVLMYGPTLKRWDVDKKGLPPMKKEILKENVDAIAFEFFVPPDKSRTKKNLKGLITEPEPKGGWRKQAWQKEFGRLPTMVKITITPLDRSDPVVYIFPLVNATTRIMYD